MKKIRSIVLATDFSTSAEPARDMAATLATALGAKLHLLHAVVLHGDDEYGLALPLVDLERHGNRVHAAAVERLANLSESLIDSSLNVTTAVRRSTHAVPAILDYVAEVGAELVVLGTHGRRGPGRWLLGSVAEEVARRSDCAVLTVRRQEDSSAPSSIRNILVPIDFSEASIESLSVARSLAALWGARLHLLHLVEPMIVPGPYGMLPVGQPITLDYDVLARQARERLVELMGAAGEESFEVQARIGSPRVEIVEVADQVPVDLIVQASRGLTGLSRLLLGSTAEHVLRTAHCPVLTVKVPPSTKED